MGLDMYAYWINPEDAGEEKEKHEIAYWRKVREVHNFMENIYIEQGGEDSFNCIPLLLSVDTLDRLEQAMLANELPDAPGFFFGSQDMDSDGIEYTQTFINRAKKLIREGKEVYYNSWW